MGNWKEFIDAQLQEKYYIDLQDFVYDRYENGKVYPTKSKVFRAFSLTKLEDTRVVILGQDPYHGKNQAHGLSFSVADSSGKFPPSLRNIFKELEDDLSVKRTNTDLSDWARQGILLLNTVLTVEAGQAGSHRNKGWEIFTDNAIKLINQQDSQVVFVLWGADAQKKQSLITNPIHKIIKSVHPSPLSAYRGFFGSKPFSTINKCLKEANKTEIKW